MDQYSIKNVKNPVNKLDAVNMAYADRIKYKTTTGIISNIALTDHTLFTFASGKIIICDMWVERLADEWIATSSPMFATYNILQWFPRQWLDSQFSPRLRRPTVIQFK